MKRFESAMLAGMLAASMSAVAAPLQFGHWQIELPEGCAATAVEVPAEWLYSEAQRDALKKNPMFIRKPSFENMPAHWHVDLSSCFPANDPMFPAQLRVMPVADYTRIYSADRTVSDRTAALFRNYTQWAKDASPDTRWDFMPFLDIGSSFELEPTRIAATGFDGGRVIVQFGPDGTDFPRRGSVNYVHQSISTDGQWYVLLIVPLFHRDFREWGDTKHLGFVFDDMYADRAVADRYKVALAEWMATKRNELTPALGPLDDIATSLRRSK